MEIAFDVRPKPRLQAVDPSRSQFNDWKIRECQWKHEINQRIIHELQKAMVGLFDVDDISLLNYPDKSDVLRVVISYEGQAGEPGRNSNNKE